jgi:two-component system chemotaxis response regulator CheB
MIRVLLVDDSALMRNVLRELIEASGDIVVAGEASNGLSGCEKSTELHPDLVVMDIDMPVMDGVAATARIMRESPAPILVFSASAESPAGFAALEAGARDVLLKPDIDTMNDDAFRAGFYDRVRALVRNVRRPGPSGIPARGFAVPEPALVGRVQAIVIGASTGGPVAVRSLLSALPAGFPVGVALVQHLEDGFDAGYVRWLGESCRLRVLLAGEGVMVLEPGTVTVAPVNRHLVVRNGMLALDDGPRIGNQKPAVDALFKTAAAWFGSGLVGVLLTGMGRDGADGCKAIVAAGGRTLVQDQDTSAIFGMPKAAIELGAATEILPLQAFAPRLAALVSDGVRP